MKAGRKVIAVSNISGREIIIESPSLFLLLKMEKRAPTDSKGNGEYNEIIIMIISAEKRVREKHQYNGLERGNA